MRRHYPYYAAALLVSLWPFLFAAAAEKPAADTEAVVTMIEGTAHVFMRGVSAGILIEKGSKLKREQEVRVGANSRMEIRFPDGTIMRLSEKSRLIMDEVLYDRNTENKNVKVNLAIGKLWANVKKLATPDSKVEVRTSNAVAGVRGTVYRVNVEADKSALVKVYDGSVYVANPPKGESGKPPKEVSAPVPVPGPHEVPPPYHEVTLEEWYVIVKSFQQVTISPDGVPSQPQDFDRVADADDWVKWNQERDKQAQF
jgi:hypothetical protein